MKLNFKNADKLSEAIAILMPDLGCELSRECEADVIITVNETDKATVRAELNGNCAEITYGGGTARFCRGLAMLVQWIKDGETSKSVTENPVFTMNGGMVDMSRNAVMNVKTVKFMLRRMALMGLNSFMLYTEDTYEIENRPYFGYMRGRYTKAELKELDKYALCLGIELIPCIQMLGHLATHLKWEAASQYKDTERVMMVGSEATYELIEDMLKTVSECFTSRKLHMGMDETDDIGRGKYLEKNGMRERQDVYFEHLNRIVPMVKAYGFKPMMWSDMFFHLAGSQLKNYTNYDPRVEFPENIRDLVPDGVEQVYWDYYHNDVGFYDQAIDKHRLLSDDILFAGGIWTWTYFCPHFSLLERNSIPGLISCRDKGIKDVIATVWHNGSESQLITSLFGLAWYADFDYKGGYCNDSVRECVRYSLGVSYDDFMKLELPDKCPNSKMPSGSRNMVYNDPLIGLLDPFIGDNRFGDYYRKLTPELKDITDGFLAPAFDVEYYLSSLLENKADFGVRLKSAYDAKDSGTLAALSHECDTVIEKLKALRESHMDAWMEYNKPFGWEVHDIRYGGLISRFETLKKRLLMYLSGKIDAIEELEAERLAHTGSSDVMMYRYNFIDCITANLL